MNDEYPLISIKWADHYSQYDQGLEMEEVVELVNTPCIRLTSGHLVYENRRQVAIAGTIDTDSKGHTTFSEIFICMKKSIIERSDVEKKKK